MTTNSKTEDTTFLIKEERDGLIDNGSQMVYVIDYIYFTYRLSIIRKLSYRAVRSYIDL